MNQLTGRRLQIWNGINIDPIKAQQYRAKWCREAGMTLEQVYAVHPWGRGADVSVETTPVVSPEPAKPVIPACIHRGPVIHQEPCRCGSATRIDIHECRARGRCVRTQQQHRAIKDADVRRTLQVCQDCTHACDAATQHPIAKHICRFACGVTSAPRPQSTLRQCVQSIIAAGFAPTVFAEPGTDVSGLTVPVVQRPQRLGCFHNYLQTLRDLIAIDPEAEAIVVFQDDIIIAQGTREFLEHDLWPSDRCGAVSLYSPDFRSYELDKPLGFSRQTGKYIMGACGMVYPRRVAESMVTHHTRWRGCAKGPPVLDETKKKAVDTWIGHAIAGERLHIYFPNPSLCQHIAETSSLGHGGNSQLRKGRHYRKSGKFAGESVTPFQVFGSNLPSIRYNSDGGMRLSEPLSVVIPAWNCFDLTSKCLTALAQNAGVSPLDVIYVDNGSDPGTVEQVKTLAESLSLPLRTIEFPENFGFAPAANAGMRAARGHVLLLNNDCYLHKGCLPAMLRHLWSDETIGSVGPLTADSGCQSIKQHKDLARRKGRRESIPRNMLVGFCQLKRREALDKVGLLDEQLAHGLGTDDDWAHRARAAGYKLLLACDAFADHDHKSTFRRSGQDRRAMQTEAMQYLKSKGTLK